MLNITLTNTAKRDARVELFSCNILNFRFSNLTPRILPVIHITLVIRGLIRGQTPSSKPPHSI
jgi:hypothetical protein